MHLYSITGRTKRALYLIIDRLHDVPKAISFARAQDDPDLWADLLAYSMDKPRFIRGLLEQVQVGSQALDPVTIVRRIPDGLEIEGLREGIQHIVKEHEIQWSISEGVARVLRSEVAGWQGKLRSGQRRGIKFQVEPDAALPHADAQPSTGRCAHCQDPLQHTLSASKGLVGFGCGHVYHLPHLLDALPSRRRGDADIPDWPSSADMGVRGYGYRVGEKVTRARLLKNAISGGCPVCLEKSESAIP